MALNTAALRFDLSVKMYNFWWCNTQILLFIWANLSSSKAGGRKIEWDRERDSVRCMTCGFTGVGLLLLEAEKYRSVVWRVCVERVHLSLSCHHRCMNTHTHTHTFTTQTCLFASLLCTGYHTQLRSFHLTPQQANKQRYKRTHKLSNTLHTCKCPFYIIKCII